MPANPPTRRADAQRNRDKILAAARPAFAESDTEVSMAEVARRAGVGMATLYRNFPGRRELLEALYTDEVDAIVAAAETVEGETPGAVLTAWLHRFLVFKGNKHHLASELLTQVDGDASVLNAHRDRVLAAGESLLAAAQASGEIRADLTLQQILDMILAITRISGDRTYVEPILRAALAGLAPGALRTEGGR